MLLIFEIVVYGYVTTVNQNGFDTPAFDRITQLHFIQTSFI